MKSFPQKEREIMRQPIRQVNPEIDYKDMARCACGEKMSRYNFNKYGKCFKCHMTKGVKVLGK